MGECGNIRSAAPRPSEPVAPTDAGPRAGSRRVTRPPRPRCRGRGVRGRSVGQSPCLDFPSKLRSLRRPYGSSFSSRQASARGIWVHRPGGLFRAAIGRPSSVIRAGFSSPHPLQSPGPPRGRPALRRGNDSRRYEYAARGRSAGKGATLGDRIGHTADVSSLAAA